MVKQRGQDKPGHDPGNKTLSLPVRQHAGAIGAGRSRTEMPAPPANCWVGLSASHNLQGLSIS